VKLSELKKLKTKTDYDKVDQLTDEEIEKAARKDPDSALPTEEQLKEFRPARKRPPKPTEKP
jgi:hypothetical protein